MTNTILVKNKSLILYFLIAIGTNSTCNGYSLIGIGSIDIWYPSQDAVQKDAVYGLSTAPQIKLFPGSNRLGRWWGKGPLAPLKWQNQFFTFHDNNNKPIWGALAGTKGVLDITPENPEYTPITISTSDPAQTPIMSTFKYLGKEPGDDNNYDFTLYFNHTNLLTKALPELFRKYKHEDTTYNPAKKKFFSIQGYLMNIKFNPSLFAVYTDQNGQGYPIIVDSIDVQYQNSIGSISQAQFTIDQIEQENTATNNADKIFYGVGLY